MPRQKVTQTKAKTLPRTLALPAALREKYKNFPGINAIERRVLSGDLPGSVDLRLKEDPDYLADPRGAKRYWYLRWINTAIPGRWSSVTQGLGYEPVKLSELKDQDSIADLYRDVGDRDPIVRRGDKGKEVLVKIPLELYHLAKRAQKDARDRRSRNAKMVKADMANAAAGALGDEAADTIHDEFNLTMHRSRATLGEESQPLTDAQEAEILDRA